MCPNYIGFTQEIQDYFDGLLLGDGCFNQVGNISAQYLLSQRYDHRDWIDEQTKFFNIHNIKYHIFNRPESIFEKDGKQYIRKQQFRLHTITYRDLLDQRKRWYPFGEKIIPRDINITNPIVLANWYMGDGSVSINKNALNICFATDGFIVDDVKWLCKEFSDKLGIDSSVIISKSKPILRIKCHHASKFLNLIKAHIVNSFQYKVPRDPWLPPKCKICNIEIVGKKGHAKYCKEHTRQAKIAQHKNRYYQMHNLDQLSIPKCKICGIDITNKRHYAKYCKDHTYQAKLEKTREYHKAHKI
jgi:hypothetical protein